MNSLKKHLRDYLELRRGLGFELGRAESRLRGFVGFMEIKRTGRIITKLAIEFALRSDRSASTQAGYLSAIRGFAQYLSGIEPKTEVPPDGLIRRGPRPQPYIYSDDEIICILNAAREHLSTPRYALKPHTLYCLFGLLSVTGMRLTEALNLRFEDIDWENGVLTIGRAKFQKSRLIPLHKSTLQELRTYIERRNRFFAERPWRRPVNRIFVSTHGGPLTSTDVGVNFRMLTRQIGIREPGANRGPRIHDLRHRFAVSTLLRWYHRGKNVDLLLPLLSTYLGHVFITGTYWYLTCTPGLMEAAAKRLERRWKGINHARD
ncbi:MAG TPA: tyrosine-type recombinase/integrase [Chthoniobacterales bacterium]|nr:tyrosine-type recombinase/integrase [Chthoniobacterales bacterium]